MYLNTHYTSPVSRKELSRELGYNESYISHVFADTMKTTIPEYVSSLRVQDAARLLKQTDHSVTQIALELGFGSIRNFNRVFLRQTGLSPREYRQGK
jgi:two-component system response regulator YesN